MTPPTVTGVSPSSGPTAGGTSVTITGTDFTGAGAVSFGATAGLVVHVNSATQITATTPADGAGTVDVTVTTGGGTSGTSGVDHFTFTAVPSAPAAPSLQSSGSDLVLHWVAEPTTRRPSPALS